MPFNFPADAHQKHICVIGDIMLDHYIFGTADRISPEAPVPVVDIKSERYTLGGAGNVLENLNAFGGSASLISVCGIDDASTIAEQALGDLPLAFFKLVKDGKRRTTVKTRVMASKHQLIRLDSEDKHDINEQVQQQILDQLAANISNIDAVILSDYRKGVLTAGLVKEVIKLCRQHGVLSIVDSKVQDLSMYAGADLVKPNKKEASLASGINIVDDDTLLRACKHINNVTQSKYIVVTLSEDGLAIFYEGKLSKMPTRSLAVSDVTGAGDTVVSALTFGLVNGLTIEQASDFANHAAAIVVAKVGSATATIAEINESFS
ncbi:D-glycero-beta-D-manno-heptose-7-phosphate kinase [Mucilaginibacter myungsuensis]|uniref:D-glycero-beta-D-manno-heptose-7-phosphate kinase n=1 Tax=Mucilaginibacter myungsuensis TaxID=649104 RepID=A0A929L1J2_9SPHI|nr:D-glycero-beta-D-manno-heptose-7-phosphate kinase [Mucilaginibacter myungsuensis]MBE9662400.1 D-glycero-beta-D-manno-heptose-7-phosphate kinase [Mucilaginibacter myungsuensis]MDN3599163.1 D-glycero-beta-D-manno-heptose-7-phosphate kinase [Mucilaginibacter myungsuensis]